MSGTCFSPQKYFKKGHLFHGLDEYKKPIYTPFEASLDGHDRDRDAEFAAGRVSRHDDALWFEAQVALAVDDDLEVRLPAVFECVGEPVAWRLAVLRTNDYSALNLVRQHTRHVLVDKRAEG